MNHVSTGGPNLFLSQADRAARAERSLAMLARLRRRLAGQRQAVSRLADHATHDFRAALTVVREHVSLLQDGLCGDVTSEQKRMLDVVCDRTDELNQMVDDLLDLSKLHTGRLHVMRRSCLVRDILDSVLAQLRYRAQLKGLELRTEIDGEDATIHCDPEMIARVLMNLGTNTVKLCSGPARLLIWTLEDHERQGVRFGVGTEGTRYAEESPPADCGQFEGHHAARRRKRGKGFRLGISVARKLVARNLGSWFEETRSGLQTALAFDVPLARPESVLARWLKRLESRPGKRSVFSAVRVRVPGGPAPDGDAAVDKLLNYALRTDDLLFRSGQGEWLLALADRSAGPGRFLEKLHAIRDDINGHRLYGELPRFEMEVEGAWRAETGTADMLPAILKLLSSEEDHHDCARYSDPGKPRPRAASPA